MKTKILPLLMISFVALSIIGVVALERVNSNPELKDAINEVKGSNLFQDVEAVEEKFMEHIPESYESTLDIIAQNEIDLFYGLMMGKISCGELMVIIISLQKITTVKRYGEFITMDFLQVSMEINFFMENIKEIIGKPMDYLVKRDHSEDSNYSQKIDQFHYQGHTINLK